MITLEQTVEYHHRSQEERKGLKVFRLTLREARHEVLLPADGHMAAADESYLIERASALRWIYGRGELKVLNHPLANKVLDKAFCEGGSYAFEGDLFAHMEIPSGPEDNEIGSGNVTVFLDLGGSSLKGLLFSNEQLARQQSVAWRPFDMRSMQDLTEEVERFLRDLLGSRQADAVSYVGVSSAGICEDGAQLVTSLTQGMEFSVKDPYDPWFLKKLVQSVFPKAGYTLINDGMVTLLPTRSGLGGAKQSVLSLVMGSNLGGGYSGIDGIHELGFMPFLSTGGIVDEWSGYTGMAASYFSKVGLLRLAEERGYSCEKLGGEREVIEQLHTDLRHGLVPARLVFQSLGKQVAPLVLFLQRYYQIDTVLLSGGILTAGVVDEMRKPYEAAYRDFNAAPIPSLRMLVVPGVLPEYNQVRSLAMNYFSQSNL